MALLSIRLMAYFSSLVFLSGMTKSQGQSNCQPRREVVSIFNNDFTTPPPFGSYFIEVNRCVYCEKCEKPGVRGSKHDYPVPNITNTIKIMVKNDADGSYYQYSIYNHISCTCGTKNYRDKKVEVTHTIVPKHRASEMKNNPKQVEFSKNPQPRSRFTRDGYNPRYYIFKQCVPFPQSGSIKSTTKILKISDSTTNRVNITYTEDILCGQVTSSQSASKNKIEDSSLFNIDSKKTFFAATLLAVVLVIILILDLTFCCRKKGFCYTLTNCTSKELDDDDCSHCEIQATMV